MHFYTLTVNYLKQKTVPFTIALLLYLYNSIIQILYLGINLTKEVKDLYTANGKTLMKEIEDTQINGKISHVHGGRVNII